MSAVEDANCAGKGPIRQCAAPRPRQRRCNDRESVVFSPDVIFGWSASVVEDKKIATDLIDRALSKSPATAMAHVIKGDILRFGHPEEALPEYDAALEINPNFQLRIRSAKELHLSSPGGRAKPSPRLS